MVVVGRIGEGEGGGVERGRRQRRGEGTREGGGERGEEGEEGRGGAGGEGRLCMWPLSSAHATESLAELP